MAAIGSEEEPVSKKEFNAAIEELKAGYEIEERGIHLIELDGKYQLCTKNEYYDVLAKIVNMPMLESAREKFLPAATEIEVMNMPKLKDAPLSLKRRVLEVKKQKFVSVINTIPMLFSKISSKDIAELDKESEISRTEVRTSKNLLKKLIELCQSKTR